MINHSIGDLSYNPLQVSRSTYEEITKLFKEKGFEPEFVVQQIKDGHHERVDLMVSLIEDDYELACLGV